jgi:hypothetical protein
MKQIGGKRRRKPLIFDWNAHVRSTFWRSSMRLSRSSLLGLIALVGIVVASSEARAQTAFSASPSIGAGTADNIGAWYRGYTWMRHLSTSSTDGFAVPLTLQFGTKSIPIGRATNINARINLRSMSNTGGSACFQASSLDVNGNSVWGGATVCSGTIYNFSRTLDTWTSGNPDLFVPGDGMAYLWITATGDITVTSVQWEQNSN